METLPGILEISGEPCDCGQPRAPIVYQGSHVMPSLDDARAGWVDLAIVLPHVRFWREHPNAEPKDEPDSDTHPIEPFLRFGVNGEAVILTRAHVEQIIEELRWFMRKSRPLREVS